MSEDVAASGTAAWIAAARARESARADRLFDDPWAADLAGDAGRSRLTASERTSGRENAFLPVRTRYFDDVLLDATRWARQVVLLGAGFDTRAYRLQLPPGTCLFELDQPGQLARKEAVLAAAGARPACTRITVAADLRGDWSTPLRTLGFDPNMPTAWLAEGVLFYLDIAAVHQLLATAAALSASRAVFAADLSGTGLLRTPGVAQWIEHRQRSGLAPPFCTDDPSALFHRHGWPTCRTEQPGQAHANFGRLPPLPEGWPGGADPTMRTYLVTAERHPEPRHDDPAAVVH